ncbi:MAG TPA: hypothetical protein PLO65_15540, partial [Caulobacter sp.]|nr:hypothetical protein [Caulobacter sp.]
MLMMPVVGAISFGAPAWLEKTSPPPTIMIVDRSGE